jgi:GNAT superfamily N-acetyltransferase
MVIEQVKDIPKDLQTRNRDTNLLWYGPSTILVAKDGDRELGGIRLAKRDDPTVSHGLMTDLQVDQSLPNEVLQNVQAALIEAAEKTLQPSGLKKIDAVVLDGENRSQPYQRAGYWPFRKTVVIEWDLKKLSTVEIPPSVRIEQPNAIDPKQLADFILHTYQPYWQWWMDEILEKPWLRSDATGQDTSTQTAKLGEHHRAMLENWLAETELETHPWFFAYVEGELLGVCDVKIDPHDNFDFGVLIKYEGGGKGIGAALVRAALAWLHERGQRRSRVITTSGMDDYDPTVYLYVQKLGGKMVAEYLDLVKKV